MLANNLLTEVQMDSFFIILLVFFIVIANIIGFLTYRKKKSLYYSAFTILCLGVLFGSIGGALTVFVINDPFAIFYGLQVAYYLLINSVIVFLIAILASVIKRFNHKTT